MVRHCDHHDQHDCHDSHDHDDRDEYACFFEGVIPPPWRAMRGLELEDEDLARGWDLAKVVEVATEVADPAAL